MPKAWTHKECFEKYGTVPRNPRWSWSGRSPDGRVVSVTFWQDQFEAKGSIYRSSTQTKDNKWVGSPGHNELLENLAWARDNCDGEIRIIVAIAKDTKASPRSIKECFPAEGLKMRISYLNYITGDFVAERIDTERKK